LIVDDGPDVVRRPGEDQESAPLIECTALLFVAVIATIGTVGAWTNGKRTTGKPRRAG
jgi:hypothetical protein